MEEDHTPPDELAAPVGRGFLAHPTCLGVGSSLANKNGLQRLLSEAIGFLDQRVNWSVRGLSDNLIGTTRVEVQPIEPEKH